MAERVITGLYEFDPYGTNPNNLIQGELHSLQTPGLDDFYFIIPFAAPFFASSLQVFNHLTNQPFVEGTDYVIGHHFVEAMDSTGKPIAGSIRFMRREIAGIARLNYRTLGGQWGFNDQAILTELANRQFNPLIRSWGMIDVLPFSFPPIPHDQPVDDFVGSDDLLEGIESIARAIEASGEGTTGQHLDDRNNPHQVTKSQVGLGLVENFGVASEQQAREGLATDVYMTAQRTAQAIDSQARQPLNNHVNDKTNPHEVTKTQVGLGSVEDFPPATDEEAEDPSVVDRYMTPYLTHLVIQRSGTGQQVAGLEYLLQQHIADEANPHNTTAADVNAYTREEVDALFGSFQADDTARFEGMTGEEWRETLPSFDDIELLIETIQGQYTQASTTIAGVDTVVPPITPVARPAGLYAGAERYVVLLTNRRAVEVPQDGTLGEDLQDPARAFYCRPDAAYYVLPDGTLRAVGAAAIMPPTDYQEGATPSVPAVSVVARPDKVYLLLDDDSVLRYTVNAAANVYTGVDRLYTGMFGPERTIFVRNDGSAFAVGDHNFATVMTNALTGLPSGFVIEHAVVTDSEVYVLSTGGELRGWATTLNNTTYAVSPLTLPAEQSTAISSVSGVSTHVAILTDGGDLHFRGNNDYGQCAVEASYGPFLDVAAGHHFTVTRNGSSRLHFWGNTPDNRFNPPASYKGVV